MSRGGTEGRDARPSDGKYMVYLCLEGGSTDPLRLTNSWTATVIAKKIKRIRGDAFVFSRYGSRTGPLSRGRAEIF